MTCKGYDVEVLKICTEIENMAKNNNKGFMDVMNRIMEYHCEWAEKNE